ncbi:hypothetical protein GCM10022420_048270 [Streptomyces iranensis]
MRHTAVEVCKVASAMRLTCLWVTARPTGGHFRQAHCGFVDFFAKVPALVALPYVSLANGEFATSFQASCGVDQLRLHWRRRVRRVPGRRRRATLLRDGAKAA